MPLPWDFGEGLGQGETRAAFADFVSFLALGPCRTIPALVIALGLKNRATAYDRARRYGWPERAAEFDLAHSITASSSPDAIATAVKRWQPPAPGDLVAQLQQEITENDQFTGAPMDLPPWEAKKAADKRHMKLIGDLKDRFSKQGKQQFQLAEIITKLLANRINKMIETKEEIPLNMIGPLTSAAVALSRQAYETETKCLGVSHLIALLDDAMAADIEGIAKTLTLEQDPIQPHP